MSDLFKALRNLSTSFDKSSLHLLLITGCNTRNFKSKNCLFDDRRNTIKKQAIRYNFNGYWLGNYDIEADLQKHSTIVFGRKSKVKRKQTLVAYEYFG